MSVVLENEGYCPVCAQETVFRAERAWLRDHYFCTKCGSIPRERALMRVIEFFCPDLEEQGHSRDLTGRQRRQPEAGARMRAIHPFALFQGCCRRGIQGWDTLRKSGSLELCGGKHRHPCFPGCDRTYLLSRKGVRRACSYPQAGRRAHFHSPHREQIRANTPAGGHV